MSALIKEGDVGPTDALAADRDLDRTRPETQLRQRIARKLLPAVRPGLGGLWQAIVFGFAGIRPSGARLRVEPRLPQEWNALELCLRFRDRPLRLRLDHAGIDTESTGWHVEERDTHWEVVPQ